MASIDDESLVGLTGGPIVSEYSEKSNQENDSNPGTGRRGAIAVLTDKVTASYNFKTFDDTEEIYWYDTAIRHIS